MYLNYALLNADVKDVILSKWGKLWGSRVGKGRQRASDSGQSHHRGISINQNVPDMNLSELAALIPEELIQDYASDPFAPFDKFLHKAHMFSCFGNVSKKKSRGPYGRLRRSTLEPAVIF